MRTKKFKVIQLETKEFAISGSKGNYYPSTVSDTLEEANEQLDKKTKQYLGEKVIENYQKSLDYYYKLCELYPEEYGCDNGRSNWGDIVC